MAAQIGALRVSLGIDSAAFTTGLDAANRSLKAAGDSFKSIGLAMQGVGATISAAITAPLLGIGAIAIGEATEMTDALGQVGAALTSMGSVAGRSLDQLKTQADALAGSSLFEDDQILRDVTANLLTFGNIAGASFDRAQQAAVDLATRMKMDLQSATILVGKALNDPVKGMAALSRAGVQLTEDQKAMVRQMVAGGDAAGAQGILLGELERQFSGSAQAARDNAPPLTKLSLAFKSMAGDIGTILLPVVSSMADAIAAMAGKFSTLSPTMQKWVVVGGAVAAALGPILVGLGAVVSAVGVMIPVFVGLGPVFAAVGAAIAAVASVAIPAIVAGLGLLFSPIGLVVAAVAGLAFVWLKWGDDIKRAVVDAATAVGDTLKSWAGAISTWGQQVGGWLQGIGQAFVTLHVDAIRAVATLFNGVRSWLIDRLLGVFNGVVASVRGVGAAFASLAPAVVASVTNLFNGVKNWLGDRLASVFNAVVEKVRIVGDAFYSLWDRVVGHSYVPDLVDGIGDHFGRLDGNMVNPALEATNAVASAFSGMSDGIGSSLEGLFKSLQSKDWKGLLGGLFDIGGQIGGGKYSKFADIGKSILGAFNGSSAGFKVGGPLSGVLPGFKDGGTFAVGGAGGIA